MALDKFVRQVESAAQRVTGLKRRIALGALELAKVATEITKCHEC